MAKVWEVEGSKQGSNPLAERPWPELVTILELEAAPQTQGKPILSADTSIFSIHIVVELEAPEANRLGMSAGYSVSPLQSEVAKERLRWADSITLPNLPALPASPAAPPPVPPPVPPFAPAAPPAPVAALGPEPTLPPSEAKDWLTCLDCLRIECLRRLPNAVTVWRKTKCWKERVDAALTAHQLFATESAEMQRVRTVSRIRCRPQALRMAVKIASSGRPGAT